MGNKFPWLVLLVMIAALASCAASQQSQPQEQGLQAPQPAAQIFQGSLVEVDAEAKTLTVKNADNKELQFAYTESTVIEGGGNSAQGLAGKSGEDVMVTYTVKQGINEATHIEILPFY